MLLMKNKWMKSLAIMFISTSLFGFNQQTHAATTYTVQAGDSLYKIGQQFGVAYKDLQSMNQLNSTVIYPGQQLTIPASISQQDKELLARLVSAEAKGEPYAGKVAVATVVLNRLDHPDFPNSVRDVIYQIDGGHYAFTPVANGAINTPADAESKKAVMEALSFRGQGNGSLYFYNPKTSSSKWILSRPVTVQIGNHVFAK